LDATSDAVKTAGGAMGGAMTTVAKGVTKFANSAKDTVTHVAQAAAKGAKEVAQAAAGKRREKDDDMDEEQRKDASRMRRREAARMRLQQRYGKDEESEDDHSDASASSFARGSGGQAADISMRMGEANRVARRNTELMTKMEGTGQEMEEEGANFHRLTQQLKQKSKSRLF
jgi:hypothetical protein